MHFTVHRDDLNSAVQVVQKAVSLRNPMPILSCLHMESANDTLTVTATDLEFGIRCIIPVKTVIEGSAALPAKYMTSFINRLPEVELNVQCDISTNTTVFSYGDSEVVLNGYPAEEFPPFPALPEKQALKVKQRVFKKMLKQVLFAVATEEHRPVFTGVNIRIDTGGILSMVATDTRRLAVCEEKLEAAPESFINIIVPGKTLNELYKLIDTVDDTFDLYLTENKIFFAFENICLMSRLIAGQYPDYRIVIPNEYVCEVRAPVSALLDAAERASLLVNNRRNVFNINFQPGSLLIYFYTETGRIREEITAEFSGDQLDVGFNVRFFIDLLRSLDTSEVVIKLSGSESPALFKPVEDDNYFAILVPAVP
jgi:DNA polymerase-3 subunit beta